MPSGKTGKARFELLSLYCSIRTSPLSFGISALRTGDGLYLPFLMLSSSSFRLDSWASVILGAVAVGIVSVLSVVDRKKLCRSPHTSVFPDSALSGQAIMAEMNRGSVLTAHNAIRIGHFFLFRKT